MYKHAPLIILILCLVIPFILFALAWIGTLSLNTVVVGVTGGIFVIVNFIFSILALITIIYLLYFFYRNYDKSDSNPANNYDRKTMTVSSITEALN